MKAASWAVSTHLLTLSIILVKLVRREHVQVDRTEKRCTKKLINSRSKIELCQSQWRPQTANDINGKDWNETNKSVVINSIKRSRAEQLHRYCRLVNKLARYPWQNIKKNLFGTLTTSRETTHIRIYNYSTQLLCKYSSSNKGVSHI